FVCFTAIACNKTGSPDCENRHVQKYVIEQLVAQFRIYLIPQMNSWHESSYTYETMSACIKTNPTDPVVTKFCKDTITIIDKMTSSFNLIEMAPTSKDEIAKQCICKAELVMRDSSGESIKLPISYTAQFTPYGLQVTVDKQIWPD
ncbi:MAG: hypothetical protein ABSH41_14150, partial [Syntrophobacteraceae bacterium]